MVNSLVNKKKPSLILRRTEIKAISFKLFSFSHLFTNTVQGFAYCAFFAFANTHTSKWNCPKWKMAHHITLEQYNPSLMWWKFVLKLLPNAESLSLSLSFCRNAVIFFVLGQQTEIQSPPVHVNNTLIKWQSSVVNDKSRVQKMVSIRTQHTINLIWILNPNARRQTQKQWSHYQV